MSHRYFLVGTFEGPMSLCRWDEGTGSFEFIRYISDDGETTPPTWISLSPCKRYIYCTNELADGASVAAYSLIQESSSDLPDIQFLNRVSACGGWPCHLAVDSDAVFVSNYKNGTVGVLPIDLNGSLIPASLVLDPSRSSDVGEPHAHQVYFATPGVVYKTDLGLDRITVYKKSGANWNSLKILTFCDFPSGNGPRHLVAHPNGFWAYVVMELTSTIFLASIDPMSSSLSIAHKNPLSYSTLRAGESSVGMSAAEIFLSSNGERLYVSNRDISNDNTIDRSSIAVFEVSNDGGHLRLLQHVYSGGRHPRHFTVTSNNTHLIVANKDSHNLATFAIDQSTGMLSELPVAVSYSFGNPSLILEL